MTYVKPLLQPVSAHVENASCCSPAYIQLGKITIGGDCVIPLRCFPICD